jgi:murein DD-endopeptidase MepM/ murein hydrolase activator NlpD
LLLFILPLPQAQEGNSSLPRIQRLDPRDIAFAQYLSDVESGRRQVFVRDSRRVSNESIAENLTLYLYTPGPEDDLLRLAARCSIPYSAIATINRLQNPGDLSPGTTLILPSIPGIFIPENPENDLERLIYSSRGNEEGVLLTINNGDARLRYRFLPGEDFKPTERVFFLNRGFFFPLRDFRITSTFGMRQNPVTGNQGFHQGLDLAAPQGTPVYAAQSGTVSELGSDPIYGNYIIITHNNYWVSLYGHLSTIETSLHQQVNSGTLIGRVGSTGQSTGPHLHFELRQNGVSRDPQRLLRLFQ